MLDGHLRDCLETEPGHDVHKYRRVQGRDLFTYVQFVDLANDARVDAVPMPEASACVSGVGAAMYFDEEYIERNWNESDG
jgi:hypothetical protein